MKENKNLIDKIVATFKDKKLKELAKVLYSEVLSYDIAEINQEHLAYVVECTRELIKVKKPKTFKVEVFRQNEEAELAVLSVSCGDLPFLIDSLNNELKNQQVEVRLVTHPIVHIKRDAKGRFVAFDEKEGLKETIVQFHITNSLKLPDYEKLKKRINSVLECIFLTVSDWRKITSKMIESIDEIKESVPLHLNPLKDESISFLEWLIANHLVFLGVVECKVHGKKLEAIPGSRLGVAVSDLYKFDAIDADEQFLNAEPVFIRKWEQRSVVHRTAHMDAIVVKKLNQSGKVIGANIFFGLFTSSVYYQTVRNIPLVRKKVATVIETYGFPETSHNCKELMTVLEQFPRGELLQMSAAELYDMATAIVSLTLIPKVKLFIRKDQAGNFINCIVFIPEKRFSTEVREVIEKIICKYLEGTVSKRYVQIGESSLTRLQLVVKTNNNNLKGIDVTKIEHDIIKGISVWSDDLMLTLQKKLSRKEAFEIYNKYKNAFDVKYQSIFQSSKAIHDINFIEKAFATNNVLFDVYVSPHVSGKNYIQLKIYSAHRELALSSTLPMIENMGLFAEDMFTYEMNLANGTDKAYIHHFRLKMDIKEEFTDKTLGYITDALSKIWYGETGNDKFNSLIIKCGINWREAKMIRAYAKYLRQTAYAFSMDFTIEALRNNFEITKSIVEFFNMKFMLTSKANEKQIEQTTLEILSSLTEIKSSAEDKVLRSFLNLVQATVRTNYYQKGANGLSKDYLAFKISSKAVFNLPKPKPYAEIFVYSTRFEAVHLRGGKVARGGLRWSDRKEDFRTEVLGLMKAQMTKNSVIVPVGSKGGFVLKKVQQSDGREEFNNEGIACYKLFLSGLLDLTDNIIHGKIVHPKDVKIYDGEDPYLVVAADKGTASFSDYANSVSAQYGFWLDDAFASGGSVGYDHKKMGITAKGGWISVVRHFTEMGIDIAKESFTCVGIGDMSGDVFGNGMLLSDAMKLVAAFNHAHIFIDPAPDQKKSFAERVRLFNQPRSQWSDYNSALISKGGGIYDRKAKTINISFEAQKILGVTDKEFTPEELIKVILKSSVDLIWNGGIGTYVKAEVESNEQIGDKANDALRVNGKEVKAKIIGEGGNLGMTQLGRIEYAESGGRLNTDFIDNSAGVDCSDHEVNIKIALSESVLSGKMKIAERNALLTRMTDEVGELVLKDNFKQTQIISLESSSIKNRINSHDWFIKHLENIGELERKIEFLPSAENMQKLVQEKGRLTRPELAVLIAYAKNSAFNMLVKHDLTKDKFLRKFLLQYFPSELQKKYESLIDGHKLKNEILCTVLINDFVNTLGCTIFHQMSDDIYCTPEQIIKAYVLVKEVFGLDKIWNQIESLPASVPFALKGVLYIRVQEIYERNIFWLVNRRVDLKDLQKLAMQYTGTCSTLLKNIKNIASNNFETESAHALQDFANHKMAEKIAVDLHNLKILSSTFDISDTSHKLGMKPEEIAKIFLQTGEDLSITWLYMQANSFVARQHYQAVALRALVNELQEIHQHIVSCKAGALKSKKKDIDAAKNFSNYDTFIQDLKSGDGADALISKMTIVIKKLKETYVQGG